MIENLLHPRIIENKDWATVLFILAFILIAFSKSVFESRFGDFMNLFFSDKYIKIYKESGHLVGGFTITIFIVQLLSFSFFIQLLLNNFGYVSKTDWVVFIQIFTFLAFFILSKYLIEKIIAAAFNIDEFSDQFNFQKVTYRSYISLLILPIDVILFYNDNSPKFIFLTIIGIIIAVNAFTYLLTLKNYQNLLFGKMFYFILYLCALEIAPYYFMYYWLTNKLVY